MERIAPTHPDHHAGSRCAGSLSPLRPNREDKPIETNRQAKQRLHEAVSRWNGDAAHDPSELIDVARTTRIDGMDAPSLRHLAGASERSTYWQIRTLTIRALDELRIPFPGTVPPGYTFAARGGVARRHALDTIRFDVVPAPSHAPGFQLRIQVNGVEMTTTAGMGMDPFDILVPVNDLSATPDPLTVAVARCDCGFYGCGSTDATIVREGAMVHWDWSKEVPMDRGVSFDAARYDEEVDRIAGDHSWETPQRAAGRMVLVGLDREVLQRNGIRLRWLRNDHRDAELFRIALSTEHHQVFVDFPWRGRDPAELARAVCAELAQPPDRWQASWHALNRRAAIPLSVDGPRWRPGR